MELARDNCDFSSFTFLYLGSLLGGSSSMPSIVDCARVVTLHARWDEISDWLHCASIMWELWGWMIGYHYFFFRSIIPCDLHALPLQLTGRLRSMYWAPNFFSLHFVSICSLSSVVALSGTWQALSQHIVWPNKCKIIYRIPKWKYTLFS